MRLAVFDIDGTLTDTSAVDAECFGVAIERVLGVREEVLADEWQVETEFVGLLTTELDRAPERCRPLPGAIDFLAELAGDSDWRVALATGGFRQSALLKLARAGFAPPAVLAASGPAVSRGEIVQSAILQANGERAQERPASVVVLGDGPWDVRTAEALALPCVGIGTGSAAQELLSLGAIAVLEDYVDRARARAILEDAAGSG